jgi:hypothetical protein
MVRRVLETPANSHRGFFKEAGIVINQWLLNLGDASTISVFRCDRGNGNGSVSINLEARMSDL